MLATLVRALPEGPEWEDELKPSTGPQRPPDPTCNSIEAAVARASVRAIQRALSKRAFALHAQPNPEADHEGELGPLVVEPRQERPSQASLGFGKRVHGWFIRDPTRYVIVVAGLSHTIAGSTTNSRNDRKERKLNPAN
jgi:hypothetical protein